MMRRLLAKFIVVATVIAASVVVTGQAAAGPPRHGPPDLVVLGDSFAAGTGNTPYLPEVNGLDCDRSRYVAYGQLLEKLRLVTLQGFPACKGATTASVIAQNQLDAITKETDIVTIQVFGNDAGFTPLAGLCLTSDCSLDGDNAAQVQAILNAIPGRAAALQPLFEDIQDTIEDAHAHAKVIVVDYGNPLPEPGGRIGQFCPGDLLTQGELQVAQQFQLAVNRELASAARVAGFTYADAAPRFRGLDICSLVTAFFRPSGPGAPPMPDGAAGVLHPNKLGQGIYAAVLAGRLYS